MTILESRPEIVGGVACFPLISDKLQWQGFSLNPGLRWMKEYRLCAPFTDYSGESALSVRYAELNLTALTLEADAVNRAGFGLHVQPSVERQRKAHRNRRDQIRFFWLWRWESALAGSSTRYIAALLQKPMHWLFPL